MEIQSLEFQRLKIVYYVYSSFALFLMNWADFKLESQEISSSYVTFHLQNYSYLNAGFLFSCVATCILHVEKYTYQRVGSHK